MIAAMIAVSAVSAWTNLAGNAISAVPVRISPAGTVQFEFAGGESRDLPLSVFPASERRRILVRLRRPELPSRLHEVRRRICGELRIQAARHAAGLLKDEAFFSKKSALKESWAYILSKPEYGLNADEISYWKERIE